MTSLSRSEILRKSPIGNGLNHVRDAYRSTCEKLGLPPSTDALSQIGNEGNSHPLLPHSY
jgi:hypothetical protein